MRLKSREWLPYGIILLLTLLVYSNSFTNDFQYDDVHTIVLNPHLKDPGNLPRFFWTPEMGSGIVKETSSYRPLLMVTFALNYLLGAMDVFGYHVLNFLIHLLCAFLVYSLTLFLLRFPFPEREILGQSVRLTALFGALIFALHPVQTESVTYINGRSSSLTTLFF